MSRVRPVILGVLFCSSLAWAQDLSGRPTVQLEASSEGKTRIYVTAPTSDGDSDRTLLRETDAQVTIDRSGQDVRSGSMFATWTEDGAPWFSVRRGSDASWWQARPIENAIMLHDGQPVPTQRMPSAQFGFTLPADGRLFLVQFRTISLDQWRDALKSAGAEVLSYLPHNTHIVRVSPAQAAAIRALDFVQRVEPFQPWYRLSPEIRQWISSPGAVEDKQHVRVAGLEWGDVGKAPIAQAALRLGSEIVAWQPNGYVIELAVTREQVRSLAALDSVAWIEPWTPKEQDMDLTRGDSGANWLEQNFSYCGTGVRGEVMDGGFDDSHRDFDGLLSHGPHDLDSHGTSTYGMVFGNGDRDGDGSAIALGHLPCGQGIAADYNELGDRFAHTQELKQAPYFATFQSNSWGDARTRAYTSISQEMDDIIWRLDFAIAQSQSNAGNQDSRPQAWAKNIISVGAVEHYNTASTSDDCWCGSASIGPAADGRLKPDISYWYDDIYTTTSTDTYTSGFGGTSAATPASAGVMGLLLQMWADNVWGTNPVGNTVFERRPHASTIKALLVNNAIQYPFSGTGTDLTRVHQGWGRPNAQNLKQRAARSFVIDESAVLTVNQKVEYDIDVAAGETELKVTMHYNDIPGTLSATLHRINDLDLKVTSPSGTVYNGNFGLDAGNYSLAGGSPDSKNNIENVFVQNPQSGLWKVEVFAREINQDQHLATPAVDHVFSLVTTGGSGSVCLAPTADFTVTPNPGRVGQSIQFDSTVSGGSGGPFSYAWDINNDGTQDSSEADPVRAYNRPFSGVAKLTVRDSVNCPKNTERSVVINGPDLQVAGYVNLTQISGNSNGAVDPGEIWEFTPQLTNSGNETAVGVTASVIPSAANAGPIGMHTSNTTLGNIGINLTVSGSAVRFQVGQDFPCGNDATFDVVSIRSTDPNNTYPAELAKIRILVGGAGAPQQFYADGFESNLGWTFAGSTEWELTNPQGRGGGGTLPGQPTLKPDPNSAAQGTRVLGTDLSGLGANPGNYEGLQQATATSPAINCSTAGNVSLSFSRWLNVVPNDVAAVEVSNNGTDWTTIYDDSDGQEASTWVPVSYDVSSVADRSPNFRVRFRLNSDNVAQSSGWNIDDLRLTGVTANSCQPVSRSTPGIVGGLTVSKSASTLTLTWGSDCGGQTLAGIYRGNLATGYSSIAAEPDKCAVSGTSTTVPLGSGTADFFLVVPNDGGFEGSYGANSAGVPRIAATSACRPRDRINACAP